MISDGQKLALCAGCRNDFYNGNNTLNVQRCWGLKTAKLVTRFRIGTWTTPDALGAFTEVRGLDCWHANGSHFYDRLPDFVKPSEVNRIGKKATQ